MSKLYQLGFSVSVSILHFDHLNSPVGSDIYQETLTKALAKHYGAKLLVVDSLLLPGVRFLHNFINLALCYPVACDTFQNLSRVQQQRKLILQKRI